MRKWESQKSCTMRKGKQTWIMRHEANSSSCMDIWNSKFGGNMYFDFEENFKVLSEFHIRQDIY